MQSRLAPSMLKVMWLVRGWGWAGSRKDRRSTLSIEGAARADEPRSLSFSSDAFSENVESVKLF